MNNINFKEKGVNELTQKELLGKVAGVSYEINGELVLIPFSRKIKHFLILEGDNCICIPDSNFKTLFDIFGIIESHSFVKRKSSIAYPRGGSNPLSRRKK